MANGKQLDFIPANSLKPGEILCGKDGDYNLGFYTQIAPSVQPGSYKDYNNLINKPQINGVTLEGNLSLQALGIKNIYYDTVYNWNVQSDLIGEKGCLYIYSDFDTIEEDGQIKEIPGMKVGDGVTYLLDLPFISDKLTRLIMEHIGNTDIHITPKEREFWNNKVTAYLDPEDSDNLILSKLFYQEGF